MNGSVRIYSWILKLYPARFREEYESAMKRQFSDEYRERVNPLGKIRLWLAAIGDVSISIPQQMLFEFWADLKQGVRAYSKRSISMILAIVALGLAIGSSTGIFSVLNALLVRSLPFSHPEELIELWSAPVTALSGQARFFAEYRHGSYLVSAAAFSTSGMNLERDKDALRVNVAETSASFFGVLGVRAIEGRTFLPDEDIPGRGTGAVIGYGLWQQLFAGDPGVIGRSVRINGSALTIVGVAPARFDYPDKTAIWVPTVFDFEKIPKRGAFLFETIGRLRPDVTLAQARQIFEAEVRRTNPKQLAVTDDRMRPRIVLLRKQLAGPVQQESRVLAGIAALALLTACANIAQLIFTRATERRQELTVRVALGASRGRLLQQLITEAMCFTTISAACGLIVARWTTLIAASVAPSQLATQRYTILDWRVLAFAMTLAVLIAVVFGVCSLALMEWVQPPTNSLRNQKGAPDVSTKRVRKGLIVLQTAITLCLVTSSFVLTRAFISLLNANLGFLPANVVTMTVSLQGTRHNGPGEWPYYSDVLNRLRALPEVEAAGAVSYLPLTDSLYMAGSFKLDSGLNTGSVVMNGVTPGYFRAMGMKFLSGRDFQEGADVHANPTAIVNAAFAQRTKLGVNIVGHRITTPWTRSPYEVRGVVGTASLGGPQQGSAPQIYFAVQEEPPQAVTFVARVHGDANVLLVKCRDAVRAVDTGVPIYDVKTLDGRLADVLARPRFYASATGLLTLMTILLAIAGIYGSTAYSLAQRRHEMGVRMALGASSGRLRAEMTRESATPLLAGIVLGLVLTVFFGVYLQTLLSNAGRPPWWASAGGAALLVLVGAVTAWRATANLRSINPLDALRAE